jgi:prevent-host-death family protein
MDVGIRELKKHLSEYVERASKGEHLRVTLRGEPVAELRPLPGANRMMEGIRDGWVTASTAMPSSRVQGAPSERSITEVVSEDRGT